MGHLRHSAVELDAAADQTIGTDREQPRNLIALHVEIGEGQRPGIVCAEHPIGSSPEAGLMRLDTDSQCRDAVRLELPDRRRSTPVDDPRGQMPEEVEDQRTGEALEELGRLRADAGQRRYWRKELVEDGGTHKRCLYPRGDTAKGTPRYLFIRDSP